MLLPLVLLISYITHQDMRHEGPVLRPVITVSEEVMKGLDPC